MAGCGYPSRNHGCSHTPSLQDRPAQRSDGGNGDSDRGNKQRTEIWRQEEVGSQNKCGGSRGMEDRMKLTDIKTARTHRESFPFLIAHIQRLVGAGERGGLAPRENLKTAQKKKKSETSLKPLGAYQAFFFAFLKLSQVIMIFSKTSTRGVLTETGSQQQQHQIIIMRNVYG